MVTIADVAERAGVSKTTVSHALSGKRPVALETRARIVRVIEELGFRPNALAQNLRMQRTQMVALIIPDITNPFFPVLARGLQDLLIEHGYYTFLCNTDSKPEREVEFVADAIHRKVDGIVLSSHYERTHRLEELLTCPIPFVSLGSTFTHAAIDSVATDDTQGAREATRYLLWRGHRRIAIIGGKQQFSAQARLDGYRAALEEASIALDPQLIIEGDFTRSGGAQAMHTLLQRFEPGERPTAIFCANDLMAIGVIDIAREVGMLIPRDLAIIGYDDIEVASFMTPPLTTVLNPAYDIGKTIGQLLLERMQKIYTGPGRHITVPHRLMQRASA